MRTIQLRLVLVDGCGAHVGDDAVVGFYRDKKLATFWVPCV
ncbi:hypothetical protein PA08_0453 [Cutibacterium modestum P08]|uniref:Uncharacterized protein n=1 Tax=Cutibacterium modestum HL044PA1 TaxID=765109 RepID=A0ABN0C440_9ACTN|nr:hypothetical protein HMPREF9607_01831 [Cutibacterium modestum HL044PA1]EGG27766.1 hypothetical protein PA08_0453 [Cutibacterium modestum P08]